MYTMNTKTNVYSIGKKVKVSFCTCAFSVWAFPLEVAFYKFNGFWAFSIQILFLEIAISFRQESV